MLLLGHGCESEADGVLASATIGVVDGRMADVDESPLYRVMWTRAPDGSVTAWSEEGTFDEATRQRVARPWLYLEEGLVYNEESWFVADGDQGGEGGYAIRTTPIDPTTLPELAPTKTGVSPALADDLAGLDGDDTVDVLVRTSEPGAPPFPLLPQRGSVSAEDLAAALDERAALADAAEADYAVATGDLVGAIEVAGGVVRGRLWTIGWIAATLPAGSVDAVAAREDVLRVTLVGHGEDGVCTDLTGNAGDPVPLGDLRVHTGVQDYLDADYHGQPASGGEVLVGIHEGAGPNDEACFYADNSGCNPSTRLREKFTCNAAGCSTTGNFATHGQHGTNVSSILIGDYSDDQGSAFENQIASGLGAGWRDAASGFGQEVEAHYYAVGSNEDAKAQAFDCARDASGTNTACAMMDILHSANPVFDDVCDAASSRPIEDALENLFDDGVFPVIISHNDNNYPTSDDCWVRSPADIPKAFTVGGLIPDDAAGYDTWAYAGYSNRGGGDVKVGGATRSEALSMVDLVASGFPGYVTDETGTYGEVNPEGTCNPPTADPGTSYAGPQVAGAAALVTHRWRDLGYSWIDNPNRLHTVMLAMGDRATNTDAGAAGPTEPGCVSGERLLCGADFYYGMGRLKLNTPVAFWHWQWVFTSQTLMRKSVGPLPSNAAMVKCVMHQVEDMTNKDNIAKVDLYVSIREPDALGDCTVGEGTERIVRLDDSYDEKHMVAAFDTEYDLDGLCLEISWNVDNLSAGTAKLHTYCYADDVLDY